MDVWAQTSQGLKGMLFPPGCTRVGSLWSQWWSRQGAGGIPMRAARPLQVLEKRDEDRMQQMQEALCALHWQMANLEDRLYLIATQLKAAGLFTAESCLRGRH